MKKKYYIIGFCLICILIFGVFILGNSGLKRSSTKNDEGYTETNDYGKNELPNLPADSDSLESESEENKDEDKKNNTKHTSSTKSETNSDSETEEFENSSDEVDDSDLEDENLPGVNTPNDKEDSVEMPFVPFD